MKKILKSFILGLLGVGFFIFASCGDGNSVSNSEDYKNYAVELCDADEMAGLKKTVSNEIEMLSLIDELVKESNEMNEKISKANNNENELKSYRAVTSEEGKNAVTQINAFVDEFCKQLEASSSDFMKNLNFNDPNYTTLVLSILNKKISFEFNKGIEIGQITFSEWIDVISEVAAYSYKEVSENFDKSLSDEILKAIGVESDKIPTLEEIRKEILDGISVEGVGGDKVVALLDKYVVIKKINISPELLINLKISDYVGDFSGLFGGNSTEENSKDNSLEGLIDVIKGSKKESEQSNGNETVLKAGGKFDIEFEVKNYNKFLAEIYKDEMEINFAVKGFSYEGQADFLLQLQGNDLRSWISYVLDQNGCPTINNAKLCGSQRICLPVCTSKGNGGYITIYVEENVTAEKVLNAIEIIVENSNDEEALTRLLNEHVGDCIKITVSSSDGTKNVWKETYNITKFYETYGKYFE